MHILVRSFGLLFLLLFLQINTLGQTPAKQDEDTFIACDFGVRIQYVKLNVINKNNREIIDLKHTEIEVYENRRSQEIVDFQVTQDKKIKRGDYRYKIGYEVVNRAEDGQYRKIEVVIKTRDVRSLKLQLSPKGYTPKYGYFTRMNSRKR